MPCAKACGLVPDGLWLPKISIIPTTVPNNPISGAAVAMVPRPLRKRPRSWAAKLPASSIASFIT